MKMWLTLLLLGFGFNLSLCDDEVKHIQVEDISLDNLEKNKAHHPVHFEKNGVDLSFHNPEPDLHGKGGEHESLIQQEDVKKFYEEYGTSSRIKKRKNHSRHSKDKVKKNSGGSSGRYRRSLPMIDPVGPTPNIRHKRFFGTWMLWEKGLVPYTFGNISPEEENAAKEAMEVFHLYTCIRFIEKDGTDDFNHRHGLGHNDSLLFVGGSDGCWSKVGHRGSGQQEISACSTKLTAIHELSHAVGAFHEHESYDRVGSVEQNNGNIMKGKENNFNPHDPAYKSFFNTDPYDLQSLMHYEAYDFSGNGLPTLDPLYRDFADPADDFFLLMQETSKVYKCWDKHCSSVDLNCANQGYRAFYNGTCQCICPAGLDPSHNCGAVFADDKGCGGILELTHDNPSVVIKAPTMDQYTGTPLNCTWLFTSPGKIKLDITELRLAGSEDGCVDTVQIRRNLLGQSGSIYCGEGFEKSVFSMGNTLAVTLKSGPYMNIDFLAAGKAIFAEENCYNWNDRGETYDGDLDRSEDYYKCVDWSEATQCNHNPFFYSGELKANYSGNSCRNPGGVLHRPWCYTEVRPTSCTIRYCEPCQIGSLYDVYDNCDDILRRFPHFCEDEEAEHGCRKTCDIANPIIKTDKCGPPPNIAGAHLTTSAKESYDTGSSVTYQCTAAAEDKKTRWCLSTGEWSELTAVCNECADQLSTCEMLLKRNHTMCSSTPSFSNKYCAATCGKCENQDRSFSAASDTGYGCDQVTVETVETPPVMSVTEPASTCTVQPALANTNTVLLTTTSTISQGEFAQYACEKGYFHQSGDMELVCMTGGVMYGGMPKCSTTNMDTTPLSDLEVIQLKYVFIKGWALVGNNRYTRINRAGAIKTWYFYCVNPGEIKLAVFRDTPNGILVVGTTPTQCDADRLNIRHLESLNEIYVEEGDYIGTLDIVGGSLTFTTCTGNDIESHVIALHDAELLKKDAVLDNQLGSTYCAYASINADIGPIAPSKYRLVNYILPSL